MDNSRKLNIQLWSEGPLICNVDPKVMPHFSFHAKCNYCVEIIPFTGDLEREMGKHYNVKHRLYCNACKKGDFSTREELEIHLSAVHKDGICFSCHASFKLASAVAMHVEGPRNDCSVPHTALVSALRYVYQKIHNGVTDPDAIYSPISCCSGSEHTVQKLKEFKKTLLLAHEKALSDMQETSDDLSPLVGSVSGQQKPGTASLENLKSMGAMGATNHEGYGSPQVKRMVTEMINNRENQEMTSLFPKEWTCSTCVDAKFTTLSKLLQHVEQKVRNSWWMSLHQ